MADAVRVPEAGAVERTTHNKFGEVTASVDELGSETISLFDRRGRLTSLYEPLRDPTVTPWASSAFTASHLAILPARAALDRCCPKKFAAVAQNTH